VPPFCDVLPEQYENNRAEQSNEPTRVRERGMQNLNLLGRLSDFWMLMQLFIIYKIWAVIWSKLNTIETPGQMRLQNEVGQ